MRILGLNAHAHDAGVALVEDGRPLFVVEEERFNRVRKTTTFPYRGLGHARSKLGLDLRDIDLVAFPWRPTRFLTTVGKVVLRQLPRALHLLRPAASPNMNVRTAFRFFAVGKELARALENRCRPRVRYVSHHLAHAANAFFLSPFDSAAVMVMDAYGDECSTSFYHATGTHLRLVATNRFLDSLGILYSVLTKYLGFRTIQDEGKVMALAAYGNDDLYPQFRPLVRLLPHGRYGVDKRFFDYQHCGELRPVSQEFVRRFGPARQPGEPITQRHMNIAYALQRTTEETILHAARFLRTALGEKNLCFAGGLALNCLANGRLAAQAGYDNVFVPPNPNDAGAALGAALALHYCGDRDGAGPPQQRRREAVSPFLGPEYADNEILEALHSARVSYRKEENAAKFAAGELARGRLVGWFQGRGEMGPRALGNRSILADPRDAFLREVLSTQVKHREYFRPYAPSVLAEHAPLFFASTPPSPYMSFAVPTRAGRAQEIPAVVARDGSARIQTVTREQNPLFHSLIQRFFQLTGVPMVLNTSFNGPEPMVCTPADALRTYLGSRLHVVIMGDYVAAKREPL